ncbi:cysteine desulfurase DndA [Motiliproteus sediminis]|uniref:cysteine desulfurase DndA n=1 Tax=Motiliproteus sediminis TaxID=1468178 RepID=UPI001AEFC74E|nr:cysteine desulfurase DndA [Motiliproteus sediminis]
MPVYLDYSATTPVCSEVAELVTRLMVDEFGNSGSRTHEFGVQAKRAVEKARQQIAEVVGADKSEVTFTSGATESDNIALLGLEVEGLKTGKKHIISSAIEHKAVLEPLGVLESRGFEVTYLKPEENGRISAEALSGSLRSDTLLVSLMHVNNETGVVQDLDGYCAALEGHSAYLHVDAAQSFGKIIAPLRNPRIDLISVSGHKIYAPKGIGALVARRRGYQRVPLKPLMYGGGQEKGLRPGTLPVPLIAGLGLTAELALKNHEARMASCSEIKAQAIEALSSLGAVYNGNGSAPYILNFSIPGVNSEAAIVALKDLVAISNGSACTSSSYTPSHVLTAMGLSEDLVEGALRFSWSHEAKDIPWREVCERLSALKV